MTFIADWPGQEFGKGKQVVGYWDYEWKVDKKAIVGHGHEGTAVSISNFAYDAVAKKIKFFNVGSNGDLVQGILWEEGRRHL